MMRLTKTEAKRRAAAVQQALPNWRVDTIKDDGTIRFEIDNKKTMTLIEFAPEHWHVFQALYLDGEIR
jgi:hypothetical protein